ncbi:MAG: hypothetical protein KJ709_00950, partial [Nanoarchaeota archaeon]|nr:hypothetical protein [Nanoarchaeota archaeon]
THGENEDNELEISMYDSRSNLIGNVEMEAQDTKGILWQGSYEGLLEPGNYYAIFKGKDRFGHENRTIADFTVKDTTGPTFTVEIGEPYPTDRVAKKGVQYPVLVTASEPLLTTPNMGYEYDGTAVDEIQLMFVDSTTFRGTLEVSGCTDCEDEAWFVIRGRDTHGQEATKRLPFNIDTTVPTAPRIIFPEEEEVLAQQDILIEGLADPDTEVNIWVKLLFGENYTEETVTSAERSTPIGIASSTTLLTAGATTINFRGDRSSYEGKYVEADGFELPRYHILQASYDEATDTTLASLDQALRYDTATSIFYVYNEEHHTGYFSLPLEAMEGVNIAQANSEDPAGPGPASEERMFVADWHPPHAEVIYPLDGTITSDVLTNVKLRVRDYTSGLDLDSVRLTLNGMAFDYWDLMYDSRDPKTRGPAVDAWHYLNLSEVQDSQGQYNPLSIQDGTYTAVFTAADSAGNTQTMQWSFEIEPTATRYPELDLEDANAFEKLYTKLEEFEGILTFFEDAVEVISSGLEPGGIVTTTPQPGQEKIHDVEFANVDIHRPHNTFTIESKEKVGNSYRQPGRHIWQIVRDDELPTINTQYPATTSDLLVPIHGKITEYSFDNLRAEGELNSLILEWEDGGTHTTVPVIGPKDLYDNSYFAAVIGLEDDEEREIPFSVKACDKAGNCRSEKYVIRIDFTPPEISGIQFQQLNSETPIELTLGTNEEAYCRWAIGMVTRYENMVNQFTAGEGSKQHTAMIDLDEGLQTYSLSCMDIAGNPMDSSVKVQIELDTTGPAFSELYPANGTMLFSTNLISARIEDRNGVKEDSILMMVDGNDVGSNLQYLSGVAMHTPGPLVEGQHTVWVGAYDNLDNYNQVQWDFTINQTIPKPPRFMLHGEETDSTNETLPVIYVIFSQPVIIYDNYTLEGEDIDLIQTDYSFTPKTRLNEGYHTFVIYARLADNSGHIGQYRFSFSIESEFDIILEEPEHGVAPTKVFDITYRTPGDATCKYDYIQEQNYDQFAHDFDITGQQEHTIYDYNISWNSFMFVACKLSFGPEKPPKLFSFRVDETPPRITELYAVPNPIAERTNVSSVWLYLTELNIKTDEPAMCRFNNETYVGYDLMQNPMGTEFVTTHTRDLTMYHDRNYTFFVSCKNRAGLNSSIKKLVVMADASLPLTARFIEIGATGSQSVRLQASTNKRAMCKFFNESWNPAGSSPFGMEHLLPLTNLKSGEHTYWINCTRNMESHKTSITFIVDLTPPVLIVNDTSDDQDNPGKSWRTDKLRLKWTAYDNETELGLVLYRLEKSSGAAIVNWTEAEEEDRWFWVDEDNSGEPLNLSDGQTYYFRVNASNTVGRSKVERTDGVTIDTSLEPPDQPSCSDNRRNQGETDIDCGGPCPGCDLDDDCEDGTDCLSEYCEDGKCEVHHCDNNRTDGDETDKDCGGSCDPCGDGKDCEEDDDCDSDYCNNGKKCATPSCTDNVKNGLETDTDCGGHHCDACADGKDCEDNTDCESTFCSSAGLCEEPTCDDNAENGDESDVDCGGSCDKCQEGKKCLANDDCTTGQCGDSGICTSSDDNDNDGMPDSWELLHGLDTTRDDSLEDPDGDTLTNIDEYRYGFDPHNADSDGDGIPDNLEIGGLGDEKPKTWTIVLLIIGILALAGFGGYYLYTHFLKKPKPYYRPVTQAPVPRQGPRRPMQKPVPKPAIPATPPKRRKLFKTRTKLFDTFEKPGKKTDKIPLKEEKGETKEEEGKWLQLGKAEPDDVFSRLKKMGRPEEARKPPKDDVFSKLKGIGKTDESTDESVDEDVFSKLKGIGDAKPKKKKGKEDVFSKLKKIGK